jgi:hypothetical protein
VTRDPQVAIATCQRNVLSFPANSPAKKKRKKSPAPRQPGEVSPGKCRCRPGRSKRRRSGLLLHTSNICQYRKDSNQSSLSQLATRFTRYGRFIRRHLFGLGPITHCQFVLGQPASMARPGAGRRVPPGSHAYAGPNRDYAGGARKSRPPHASQAVTVTTRSPAASQRAPRGPRACRAKRGSRDSADRARLGPAAGS